MAAGGDDQERTEEATPRDEKNFGKHVKSRYLKM